MDSRRGQPQPCTLQVTTASWSLAISVQGHAQLSKLYSHPGLMCSVFGVLFLFFFVPCGSLITVITLPQTISKKLLHIITCM